MARGSAARRSSSNSVGKLTTQVKAQIVQDFDDGVSIEEITTRHGLTHVEYARRVIKKEKGDHVLPKTPPVRGKRQRSSVTDELSDTESIHSNHSYSLRERNVRTPQSASKITPKGRCRRPSHERNCNTCDSETKRKKARVLSPVAEPLNDDYDQNETDVEMSEAPNGSFHCFVKGEDLPEARGAASYLTPQMAAQIRKRELNHAADETSSYLGSGLKQLFTGSLFGNKSTNTSFEAPAPPTRRSVNLSPAFGYPSRSTTSAQTTKENIVDKSYVDFLMQSHREELQARDDLIAERDGRIAELEREKRTLLSDIKRLKCMETREKGWKKYF